jgi:hypothetical protein
MQHARLQSKEQGLSFSLAGGGLLAFGVKIDPFTLATLKSEIALRKQNALFITSIERTAD